MSEDHPTVVCAKCGSRNMEVQADHNPGSARCGSCGHEVHFLFDPAMPEGPEDTSDGVLRLEDAGPDPLAVAAAIRTLTGLDSRQALALVRSAETEIARRNHYRLWELEDLKGKLDELGAKSRIVRC